MIIKGCTNICGDERIYWELKSREWLAQQPVIRYDIIKHIRADNMRSWDKLEEDLSINDEIPLWCSVDTIF